MNQPVTHNPRRLFGVVVGNAADKTIKVRVERRVKHPMYNKVVKRHNNYLAHDADNTCRVRDEVIITECPRFSKRKSWRLERIVNKTADVK